LVDPSSEHIEEKAISQTESGEAQLTEKPLDPQAPNDSEWNEEAEACLRQFEHIEEKAISQTESGEAQLTEKPLDPQAPNDSEWNEEAEACLRQFEEILESTQSSSALLSEFQNKVTTLAVKDNLSDKDSKERSITTSPSDDKQPQNPTQETQDNPKRQSRGPKSKQNHHSVSSKGKERN
jgi:hypothetical protein